MTVDRAINLLVAFTLIEKMFAVRLSVTGSQTVAVAKKNWRLLAGALLANDVLRPGNNGSFAGAVLGFPTNRHGVPHLGGVSGRAAWTASRRVVERRSRLSRRSDGVSRGVVSRAGTSGAPTVAASDRREDGLTINNSDRATSGVLSGGAVS